MKFKARMSIVLKTFGVFVAGIFFFHGFCFSEKDPHYTFVKDATLAPATTTSHDYIVIGGGTAGCPLAATLSQGGAAVLVLERGGSPYGNPNIANVGNFLTSLLDTSPGSPTQLFLSEDGVFNHRARVLGGGSALNAGFFTRAEEEVVAAAGWDPAAVEQSYEWAEKVVAFEPELKGWQAAFKDGLVEAGVLPYNGFTYKHLYGTKVGGSIFDKDGHRHTAADLLQYADPAKISVHLHATVQKILFRSKPGKSRPEAYGVIYKDAKGGIHKAYLNDNNGKSEVILSAGALGSPQLLMLSGIGPVQHLRAHGIEVVLDQSMVGQGLSDNPMNVVFVPSPIPVEISLIQAVGITKFGSYIEAASGLNILRVWALNLAQYYEHSINQTSDKSLTTTSSSEAIFKANRARTYAMNLTIRGGIILEKINGPRSTGHLELKTTNPDDNPSVTFNYFKEEEDLEKCIQGMKTIIEVLNSKAFSKYRYPYGSVQTLIDLVAGFPANLRPRHLTTALSLERFCMDTVITIWHYHGGCQVGKVVDSEYKVIGVDALRVVDGSTFLSSPGTNPQATVMMLGRYVGSKILRDRSTS